MIGKLL